MDARLGVSIAGEAAGAGGLVGGITSGMDCWNSRTSTMIQWMHIYYYELNLNMMSTASDSPHL